jgi:hypothetical protein
MIRYGNRSLRSKPDNEWDESGTGNVFFRDCQAFTPAADLGRTLPLVGSPPTGWVGWCSAGLLSGAAWETRRYSLAGPSRLRAVSF